MGDAMRSTHAPKAHITDEVCITHAVRITFRKERITQKSLFCPVDKRDFFVGAADGTRTRTVSLPGDFKSPVSTDSTTAALITHIIYHRQRKVSSGWRDPPASACQKSPYRTFLTASAAERFESFKTLLRPKSLKNQAFLRRVIVTRGGPCPLALPRASVVDD